MKKRNLSKLFSVIAAASLTAAMLAGCGSTAAGDSTAADTQTADSTASGNSTAADTQTADSTASGNEDASSGEAAGGKILFLSSLTSGAYYDYEVGFYEAVCSELGYDLQVIYGDSANDPDGNLSQVKNAYTDDVVGLITMMDGGIASIMDEYPDLYVVGFANSMTAIYGEDAVYADLQNNEHWLGCINESSGDGEAYGKQMAQNVIDYGYKKISLCIFPAYAYPEQTVAATAFTKEIEAYNETASEPIEIVDDEPTVLMFSPLEDSFFMEDGHSDLDAIVGFCAGTKFIYPTMVTAKATGTCSADTKLITGGYDNEEDLIADCGDEGQTITGLSISCPEFTLYPIALLDNALTGKQYSDWNGPELVTPGSLVLHTTAEFQMTKNDSPIWDADMSKLSVSLEDMKQYFTRYNENASYADMVSMIQNVNVESYMNK